MGRLDARGPGRGGHRRIVRLQRASPVRAAAKIILGVAGLFLFVLALRILKAAAEPMGPLLVDAVGVSSPASSLGFGWLLAYVVMSGSPVAAVALTFFAADALDALQTFTMIAGSRFGASLVVLLVAFLYALRGKARGQSLEMGVLSLLTTYVVYGVAIPLGVLILASGALDGFRPATPAVVVDVLDLVFAPLVQWGAARVPPLLLFVLGMLTILASFGLFDAALPDLSRESPIQHLEAHVYRPSVMFALGAVVTLFTLSVSVSLGILVPLSAKGIARRENVIPYIMGANITTFVDTLFATFFLGKPEAFTVVVVEMLSVALVSLAILALVYPRFERMLLGASAGILRSRPRFVTFLATILVVPLLLLLV